MRVYSTQSTFPTVIISCNNAFAGITHWHPFRMISNTLTFILFIVWNRTLSANLTFRVIIEVC